MTILMKFEEIMLKKITKNYNYILF